MILKIIFAWLRLRALLFVSRVRLFPNFGTTPRLFLITVLANGTPTVVTPRGNPASSRLMARFPPVPRIILKFQMITFRRFLVSLILCLKLRVLRVPLFFLVIGQTLRVVVQKVLRSIRQTLLKLTLVFALYLRNWYLFLIASSVFLFLSFYCGTEGFTWANDSMGNVFQ